MSRPPRVIEVNLRLPTQTILKALLAAFVLWVALRLWPELVFLSISLVLAVALEPLVAWLSVRGMSRAASVMSLAIILLLLTLLTVACIMPPLVDQLATLADDYPHLQSRVLRRLPADNPMLATVVEQMLRLPSSPALTAQLNQPLVWGRAAASALMTTFFVLVATLYLLLDGRRMYAWLLAYVPRRHRAKMAATVPEVSRVIQAYVRGQVLTSLLVAVFSAAVLGALKVPAAIPLAILAGLCDVIPLLGFVIATLPAVMLALTVSPTAAAIVVVAYVLYHLFETYFIVPLIYGSSLRISTLTVLLALIVGGTLQGILGAALILPIVAAYPIVERIWLKAYLAREVLADHDALASAAETGSDGAVEAVLQGEKHPGERLSDTGHP